MEHKSKHSEEREREMRRCKSQHSEEREIEAQEGDVRERGRARQKAGGTRASVVDQKERLLKRVSRLRNSCE